jgi:predicted nuclease of predicted toxin-antitoxin system
MKFIVDMNLSPAWATSLTNAGWEAKHWSEIGRADASDQEILEYALTNEFVVLTHDLDFGTILARTQGNKPSVVQIRAMDISPEAISKRTLAALRHVQSELEAGALLTIEADRSRVRSLPLGMQE